VWGVVTISDTPETGVFRYFSYDALRAFLALAASASFLLSAAAPGLAKPRKHHARHPAHAARHAPPQVAPFRAAILIDSETGAVLSGTNPDTPTYPASLTKMMTLYLTFAAVNDGRLALDERLAVSAHAASQEPTKLWLKSGDTVRVRSLILALVTRSANDAAVVLAEGIAGNEIAFAKRMTKTARQLGMTRTVFRNASGLPDPEQRTTARDLARLALALYQNFPREFDYFSVRKFVFRGRTIAGHNHLLDAYKGSDGIKTGFTRAAGFNLAASAERGGQRLIGVVLGSPSWKVRDKQMATLLDRGFAGLASSQAVAAQDRVLPYPDDRKASGTIARLAALASPVGTARAATAANPRAIRRAVSTAAVARRSIQLGAFRARRAAQKLAHAATHLPAAKGKAVRILKVARGPKRVLYTVQLSTYTERDARSACAALKKKFACYIVPTADES
jgi:D-alanyl-D-alanine carboxypeptidase